MDKIDSFRDRYSFLSNFYEKPVEYNGLLYSSNEAAFQAQKTMDMDLRSRFGGMNAPSAKKHGRKIPLRNDWEQVKDAIMYEICLEKFKQNPDLRQKLLATGNAHLEEDNCWGDREWGTVNGVGKNKLGKILMRVRSELKES